jgi:hypothetical protein
LDFSWRRVDDRLVRTMIAIIGNVLAGLLAVTLFTATIRLSK